MTYSHEVEHMCCVAKGPNHGPAPIPEEGKWIQAKEIKDISGLTHGIGWCAPQQGTCKLTLNVKEGVIEECLVETIGCSGMTHSAAMASEILPGKTILEALNTDLVCDAINTAMRELFLQIVYGRTQSAFSEGGLMIGAGLEDLGKGLRSQTGTLYGTKAKGTRYLELTEGYITRMALDKDNQVIGYEFVHMGKFMEQVKKGVDANEALKAVTGTYGRFKPEQGAVNPNKAQLNILTHVKNNRRTQIMIRPVQFESQDRRMKQILAALNENGIKDIEEANAICDAAGLDPYLTCQETQGICFENAKWAYVVGCAIALKKGCKNAADAAEAIGIGLQAFCIPGSVADDRKVGLGHGNLAARLLREETQCFAFLAGHESFAAAEGAIKIAEMANKVRKNPLRCILNGLGKDAAMIISRINGFTYVQTKFDYFTGELNIVKETPYSDGPRAKVKCYGADDVREGVAIMWHENVDVSITGNSTNPTRFQHPVAGTYKKERVLAGKPYFSVASGGGTGRTLHPDNMAAGPASYGMTDTMGRMHSDAQFAGSSSVPAHVEMMGFLGIGNNPMVGCTVACAVNVALALNK